MIYSRRLLVTWAALCAGCGSLLGLEPGERIVGNGDAAAGDATGDQPANGNPDAATNDADAKPRDNRCAPNAVACAAGDKSVTEPPTAKPGCPNPFARATGIADNGLYPTIASDGSGTAVVAWGQLTRDTTVTPLIGTRFSKDDGATFQSIAWVGNPNPQSDNDAPSVTADGADGYLLTWRAMDASNRQLGASIWSAQMPKGATQFGAPVRITRSGIRGVYEPAIAVDPVGVAYVAFQANWRTLDGGGGAATGPALYLATSTDHGATWSREREIPQPNNNTLPAHPRIAVTDTGDVVVAYVDTTGFEWGGIGNRMYTTRLPRGAAAFDAPIQVGAGSSVVPHPPALASAGTGVSLAYVTGDMRRATRIMLAHSRDGGASWQVPTELNDDGCEAIHVSPALHRGTAGIMHATYTDSRLGKNQFAIWHTQVTNGAQAGAARQVSDVTANQPTAFERYPSIGLNVRGGRVLITSALPQFGSDAEVRVTRAVDP
jgi:hypothetical protein